MYGVCGYSPSALGADDPMGCNGTERSTRFRDLCCAQETWSNGVMAAIKGQEHLQYLNENRLRVILDMLLVPEALDTVASYLGAASVPGGLEARVARAKAEFARVRPPLWTVRQLQPGESASTCGHRGVFRYISPPPPAVLAYAMSAAGQRLISLIARVPTGELAGRVGTRPTFSTLTSLFVAGGQALAPTGWLKELLDLLAPQVFTAAAFRAQSRPLSLSASAVAMARARMRAISEQAGEDVPPPPPAEEEGLPSWELPVGIGIGVLVVGALAWKFLL